MSVLTMAQSTVQPQQVRREPQTLKVSQAQGNCSLRSVWAQISCAKQEHQFLLPRHQPGVSSQHSSPPFLGV